MNPCGGWTKEVSPLRTSLSSRWSMYRPGHGKFCFNSRDSQRRCDTLRLPLHNHQASPTHSSYTIDLLDHSELLHYPGYRTPDSKWKPTHSCNACKHSASRHGIGLCRLPHRSFLLFPFATVYCIRRHRIIGHYFALYLDLYCGLTHEVNGSRSCIVAIPLHLISLGRRLPLVISSKTDVLLSLCIPRRARALWPDIYSYACLLLLLDEQHAQHDAARLNRHAGTCDNIREIKNVSCPHTPQTCAMVSG